MLTKRTFSTKAYDERYFQTLNEGTVVPAKPKAVKPADREFVDYSSFDQDQMLRNRSERWD